MSAYTVQQQKNSIRLENLSLLPEFVFYLDCENIVIGSREPLEIGLFLDFDRFRMA